MRRAEQVTFGGSDLDRSAAERRDSDGLAAALAGGAGVIALWQGKPLVAGDPAEGPCRLVRLPAGHPVLSAATEAPIFLGRIEGAAVFAQDISGWVPPEPVDEAQIAAFLDPTVQRHPAAPDGSAFRELRGIMTRLDARDAELAATARALWNWHRSHGYCAKCGAPSEVAEAGWQRLCPACGAHHFPRTDPVVIMLVTRGDRVLLGRSPGWPDGMFSLLAGFVEPGETIEAAVRREVFEETAVRVGQVDYLAGQPWPFPASLMIGCHGAALSDEITVDPNELEAARWVTRAELLTVFAGKHPEIRPARRGAIAHFLLEHWLADRLD
ncbi:NAD(+) diphosphatase [Roseicyclus persicicus]|uniref:NAD(+) diphosphatase n=1 Tax=Roseicyclus persicicus TaxID=2650661 RepID=A0A7X6GV66_9RHOB|nr:NAD(+) diphosphatase [Roseibacterium persicicum]NKX42965.1 NAD(+) diphosphatase [Roseibacterium persicicum]